jgi:hypothetical protein
VTPIKAGTARRLGIRRPVHAEPFDYGTETVNLYIDGRFWRRMNMRLFEEEWADAQPVRDFLRKTLDAWAAGPPAALAGPRFKPADRCTPHGC